MELISMKDTYAQSGKPTELLERYGLTANDIARGVRAVLKRK
jgi:transketolase